VLEQEATGAGADRVVDVFVEVEGRQHDHSGWVRAGEDGLGGGEPVHPGHADVQQDHVRVFPRDDGHSLLAVGGFPGQFEVAVGVEYQCQPSAHHGIVVGDDHAQCHDASVAVVTCSRGGAWAWPAGAGAPGGLTGRWARTVKPPSGRGPASTVPPKTAARSRMPTRPLPGLTGPGWPGPDPWLVTSMSTAAGW